MVFRCETAALGLACLLMLTAAGGARAASDDDLVKRGEYVAKAADCMPCHTGPDGKAFAGGLGLNTPFGVIYSPNITSDKTTGIGGWTYDQFEGAVRNGIRADGAYLYPAMPFDAYTLIEDDDLKALWAYISQIEAVEQEKPENGLSFPFNVRLGMLAWRELFFTDMRFKPAASKSEEWNRGAYLVEALGHCADCHTPRNMLGGLKTGEQYSGAEIDHWFAPDIESDALAKLDGWTQPQLVEFLRQGSDARKSTVFGPMAEVIHDSLSQLTDQDVTAIAAYLLDRPADAQGAPSPAQVSPLPAAVHARAATLYVDNCLTCHQEKGGGQSNAVPPLAGNPAVIAGEPYNVVMAVLEGLPSDGTYGAMPSFAGRLDNQQIADLANYVRTSWGNDAPPNATASMVAAWRAAAAVPPVGTESAERFDCPAVGGAPGAAGPDPSTIDALADELSGGASANVPQLVAEYESAAGVKDVADVVNGLVAAYCPILAKKDLAVPEKQAALRRFATEVATAVSDAGADGAVPPRSIIWAIPIGRSLSLRQPTGDAATFACPADDGKAVPAALSAQARTLLGTPDLPLPARDIDKLTDSLSDKQKDARPADVANALILAYCTQVAAHGKADVAEKRTAMNTFAQEVVQVLQTKAAKELAAK